MVDITQGMPAIVADILAEAGRPMTIKELAAEIDRLGCKHARPSTYLAAASALARRRKYHRDVERVGMGRWARK